MLPKHRKVMRSLSARCARSKFYIAARNPVERAEGKPSGRLYLFLGDIKNKIKSLRSYRGGRFLIQYNLPGYAKPVIRRGGDRKEGRGSFN